MQLRITAEDPTKGFTLSMGRITRFQAPQGPGVRTDTHLSGSKPTIVGSSYDSLLVKLIVRASSFEAVRLKALRALSDTLIDGVMTNLSVLKGITLSPAFRSGHCSTTWLEANIDDVANTGKLVNSGGTIMSREPYVTASTDSNLSNPAGLGAATILFRKGDGFKAVISDTSDKNGAGEEYLLRFDRVLTNNFPNHVAADVSFVSASEAKSFYINLASTTQTSVASSHHRRAEPDNPKHVGLPFPGQFVELFVEEGDEVREGEVLCVVRQMKMELEVRAPFAGAIKWACEDVEDGETVNEGLLVCELEPAHANGDIKVNGGRLAPWAKL